MLNSTLTQFPLTCNVSGSLVSVCGICNSTPPHIAGHMLSAHPGCGLLWGAGYCGNIIGKGWWQKKNILLRCSLVTYDTFSYSWNQLLDVQWLSDEVQGLPAVFPEVSWHAPYKCCPNYGTRPNGCALYTWWRYVSFTCYSENSFYILIFNLLSTCLM